MLVLFVSECERRAFVHTRQILCRYATQIGRRTWLARLSLEGLQTVHEALRAKATRQMAVACHRVRGRQRYELLWIVGSRRHFAADGSFAFSQSSKAVPREPYQSAPMERGVRYLAELAGLFHDLGKDNAVFQDKLSGNARTRDPLRHEYLSCLLLQRLNYLAKRIAADNSTGADERTGLPPEAGTNPAIKEDIAWLRVCAEPALLDKALNALCKDDTWSGLAKTAGKDKLSLPDEKTAPLLRALAWLVLTHHRLPAAGAEPLTPAAAYHRDENADPALCLQLPAGTQRIWQSGRQWNARVVAISARLLRWWHEHGVLLQRDADAWWLTVTVHGRAGLMLADQRISAADSADRGNPNPATGSGIYANTRKAGGMAAPLERHLFQVGREAGQFAMQLFRLRQDMPVVPASAIPAALRPDEQAPELFRWQHAIVEKIKAQRRNSIGGGGFFGLVMAGTGSGKTRGCAAIMAALGETLRYTVALGLRSLTRQTGDAYRTQLELQDERYLAVLIGASLDKRVEQECAQQGSESAAAIGAWDTTVAGEWDVDQPLPERISALGGKRPGNRLLLAAPILVCTVDHLVTAADPRRSYHLLPLIRLLSADVVLDEIDNYSEQDLIVLGKLIFLAGFAGRRVILSSATLSPPLAEALFEAYQQGYRHYLTRSGQQQPLCIAWVSDLPGRQQLRSWDVTTPTVDFAKAHQRFCASLIDGLDQRPVSRRVNFLPLPAGADENQWWPVLAEACRGLHDRHALPDPATGKRLSIGLVRTANIGPCWRFARYLAQQPTLAANHRHSVVAYHGRLLPVVRFELERLLDELLVRKDEARLWQHPAIRRLLDGAAESNVMLIIVATPVEEIGRDHDFDWGIIEPSSARSIVQCAGRIRRHRPAGTNLDNVLVLTSNFNALQGRNVAYTRPGPESRHYPLATHDAEQLLPAAAWRDRLDNRTCLLAVNNASAPMSQLEQRKLRDYLLDGSTERACPDENIGADLLTLRAYITDRQQWLLALHAEQTEFRQQAGNETLYWLEPLAGCWLGETADKEDTAGVPVDSRITRLRHLPGESLFLPEALAGADWETLYATLAARYYSDAERDSGHAARQLLGIRAHDRPLIFHPWLGLDYVPASEQGAESEDADCG